MVLNIYYGVGVDQLLLERFSQYVSTKQETVYIQNVAGNV